ncbi:MAG TPA: hypothetical protein VK468_07650 [Pyrinomonadaceae bacterium]|nr:hypothetical protein [Pyrinomonadaceae bacterium]
MKSTLKLFLVLALFCGTALADGDMGAGGLTSGTSMKEIIVVNDDGDMGAGGKTCPSGQTTCFVATDNSQSILDFVRSFLSSIL